MSISSVMSPEFGYDRRFLEGGRAEPARLTQQQRQARAVEHEVVRALRSVGRDRDAGIGAVNGGEVAHPAAAVRQRIGGAQDRVAVVAQNRTEQPLLRRRPPRQPEARRDVVRVRLVRVRVRGQVLILRDLARQRARLEQVAAVRSRRDARRCPRPSRSRSCCCARRTATAVRTAGRS